MLTEEKVLLDIFFNSNRDELLDVIDKAGDFYLDDYEDFYNVIDLSEYSNRLLNKDNIENIYAIILDGSYLSVTTDLQDILELLCYYYITQKDDENDYTYKFIKDHTLKELYSFFKVNKSFGCTLIFNYYMVKINKYNVLNDIRDKELISRFSHDRAIFITDHIRSIYENCINTMLDFGMNEEDITKAIYIYLTNCGFINTNREEIENSIKELMQFKELLLRIIYADLYEDIKHWGDTEDEYDILKELIEYNVSIENYNLPNNKLGLDILERFTELIYDPATREYNRNTLSKENIKTLKKVNPFYNYERVMLGYED